MEAAGGFFLLFSCFFSFIIQMLLFVLHQSGLENIMDLLWQTSRSRPDSSYSGKCWYYKQYLPSFFSPTVFFKLLSIHTVSCSPQCEMTELQFDLKLYHMCKRCWTILRECHYSSGCSKDNHVCVCDGSKVLRIHELRFFFTGSRHWGVAPHILHTLDGKVQGLGF